ncbi:MAG: metallophosphoesterase [Bacteroides fragilis]|nr:metallophosphoesterase [Bacteroides fragilis]
MLFLAAFFVFTIYFLWFSNNHISISHFFITSPKVSSDSPLSIVHISDLHNKCFYPNQYNLVRKIRSLHPDIIVITGDLVDNSQYKNAEIFVQKISRISTVYYITGNHESMSGNFDELKQILKQNNIIILDNTSLSFVKGKNVYSIYGLTDPHFYGYERNYTTLIRKHLDSFTISDKTFNILLSHRPELFNLYSSYNFDLVLCGHAHGGQFRLPFIGGLIAPNQGLLPHFSEGLHTCNHTNEIISRGLGNSIFPFRIFNFPEIISIQIK